MSLVSHQTIRLSAGKHSSPEEGACVMELASMLAGEAFTDHPACVCPVIGSFLRAYNDSVDDNRRQDLYAYAAMVVGTLAPVRVQQARCDRLALWSSENFRLQWARFLPDPVARALAHLRKTPTPIEALGARAVHSIRKHTLVTHRAALELIEDLIAIGDREHFPESPTHELDPPSLPAAV